MSFFKKFSIAVFIVAILAYGAYEIHQLKIVDNAAPVIHFEEDTITISVSDGKEKILSGVTAEDNRDGDVSDTLVVEKLSTFISPGRRLVTYAAFDSSGNVGKASREVVYSDYTEPKFTLSAPLRFVYDAASVLDYIQAEDCLDGDVTNRIRATAVDTENTENGEEAEEEVNYEETYRFEVSNSAGDVEYLTATVEFCDRSQYSGMNINLKDYLIYLEKDAEFDPYDYFSSVVFRTQTYGKNDLDELPAGCRFTVKDPVDTEEPGTYEVQYKLRTETATMVTRLIVIVEE